MGSCLGPSPGGTDNKRGAGDAGRGAPGPGLRVPGPPDRPPGVRPRLPLFPPGWPPGPEDQPSAETWALARKLHIPPAVLAAEIASGKQPALAVAWLLVTDRRAPHDPDCGGALAYFLAHCKGAAEPPQWALLEAAVSLRLQKLLTVPKAELRAKALEGHPHAAATA